MRRALVAAALLAATGCGDGGATSVVIALDVSALTGPAADPGDPMIDDLGLADMSRYPVVIVARIEADDLSAPVVASWPETVPEGAPETVELELEVEAGSGRRVSLDLIVAEESGAPATFTSPGPGRPASEVEVTAGETTDVELDLTELDTAPVRAMVPAGEDVASVAWVDDRAGATHPPLAADGAVVDTELAVGRTYWPRVFFGDGTSVALDALTVRPESSGELITVDLDLD